MRSGRSLKTLLELSRLPTNCSKSSSRGMAGLGAMGMFPAGLFMAKSLYGAGLERGGGPQVIMACENRMEVTDRFGECLTI